MTQQLGSSQGFIFLVSMPDIQGKSFVQHRVTSSLVRKLQRMTQTEPIADDILYFKSSEGSLLRHCGDGRSRKHQEHQAAEHGRNASHEASAPDTCSRCCPCFGCFHLGRKSCPVEIAALPRLDRRGGGEELTIPRGREQLTEECL